MPSKNRNESAPLSSDFSESRTPISFLPYSPELFPNIEQVIARFKELHFLELTFRKRFKEINQTLCQLIRHAPSPAFLLSALLDFFDRVNQEKVLREPLNLPLFEFWLNHFSSLSEEENHEIRGKIIGKHLPRDEYQAFFPIGMGKVHFGTHFVVAHLSPDIDTMIASFWGWADAFGARVGSGLHVWFLPGGPPDSPATSLFSHLFAPGLFTYVARTTSALTLTAMDLVTQKLLTKEVGHTVISTIDHGSNEKAVILVNEQGHYLGDWRSSDVELVRQVIILFKACLHWFENHLHMHLISLFAREDLSVKELPAFNFAVFDIPIKDCEPAQEFNEKQQRHLNDFFHEVLGVENGFKGTFRELNEALHRLSIQGMLSFQKEVEALHSRPIFDDEKGLLREHRPEIFHDLKALIKHLDEAIFEVRNYVEQLDVVLNIKHKVLGFPYTYITLCSDVDEMRQKMENQDFITVVIHEQDGSLFPVGIVRASDLRENGLGTVTLRDFCNLEEIRMASYLEVISVVDHHRSSLKTASVPTALIGDVQSCNVLIAEQMFRLNDKYSLGGMTQEKVEAQIKELSMGLAEPAKLRILQRLLRRQLASHQKYGAYYIHPQREFIEYLSFLHAILDDTDLLTKASLRDLECVAELLNRMKSLSLHCEVEIIHFDDLPRNKDFVKGATQRILQQADMYSLYKEIYSLRESEVESHLALCIQGQDSTIFMDTKEQNGCARVGQTKMFASNFPFFFEHVQEMRNIWFSQSQTFLSQQPEIDLYLHMISTIPSAEEVYQNQFSSYRHQDELWLWTSPTPQGYRHLNHFLKGFQHAVRGFKKSLSVEFLDSPPKEFMNVFELYFSEIPKKQSAEASTPIAVLRFNAGAVNSRKSMITPYLPRLR